MNTLLTEDQLALEDSCRKLLQNEWPMKSAITALSPGGARHSHELWRSLASAGWLGYPYSSEAGGSEGDLIDLGIIYRVAGEHMVPSSFYSSMFAGFLVDALGTPVQKRDLLGPMIAGEKRLTVASAEPHAAEETRLFKTTAMRTGDSWVLDGVKSFVADFHVADAVLVLARLRAVGADLGWGVFAVPQKSLVSASRELQAFGGTSLSEIRLERVSLPSSALLGGIDAGAKTLAAYDRAVDVATSLQCMEMAGGTKRVLDMTVEYVRERKQFGKPIGANQAVQQMLANVAIALDGVRVAALKALFLVAKGREAGRSLSIAKIAAGEAYVNATIIALQLWGAMGYSRETGLFLWTERAKVTDAWFGTRASHLSRLTRHLNLVA